MKKARGMWRIERAVEAEVVQRREVMVALHGEGHMMKNRDIGNGIGREGYVLPGGAEAEQMTEEKREWTTIHPRARSGVAVCTDSGELLRRAFSGRRAGCEPRFNTRSGTLLSGIDFPELPGSDSTCWGGNSLRKRNMLEGRKKVERVCVFGAVFEVPEKGGARRLRKGTAVSNEERSWTDVFGISRTTAEEVNPERCKSWKRQEEARSNEGRLGCVAIRH